MAQDVAAVPGDSSTLTKEAINTAVDIMGLSATFRTQSELNALGRYGEAHMDIADLRERTKEKMRRLPRDRRL
jgi:hypothetical protein